MEGKHENRFISELLYNIPAVHVSLYILRQPQAQRCRAHKHSAPLYVQPNDFFRSPFNAQPFTSFNFIFRGIFIVLLCFGWREKKEYENFVQNKTTRTSEEMMRKRQNINRKEWKASCAFELQHRICLRFFYFSFFLQNEKLICLRKHRSFLFLVSTASHLLIFRLKYRPQRKCFTKLWLQTAPFTWKCEFYKICAHLSSFSDARTRFLCPQSRSACVFVCIIACIASIALLSSNEMAMMTVLMPLCMCHRVELLSLTTEKHLFSISRAQRRYSDHTPVCVHLPLYCFAMFKTRAELHSIKKRGKRRRRHMNEMKQSLRLNIPVAKSIRA